MYAAPSPAATPLDVITAVRRVNKILRRRFEQALEEMGVSYAQYEVMLLLQRDGNLHAAAIARNLKISRQAVQGLLEKLVRAGLVDLLPRDGGVVGMRLTDLGQQRINFCSRSLHDTEARIARLPIELRGSIVEELGTIERALARPLDGNWL